jgi:AraC-like DNA-binding protein
MGFWSVSFLPKSRCHVHTTPPGLGHPLLVPPSSVVFRDLRVSAALNNGDFWWVIHAEPSITDFDLEHGATTERRAYNGQKLAQSRRTKKLVRGRHGGYSDLFVPVVVGGEVVATLVVGPFADERSTGASVLSAWRRLTSRQGHPADPEFAAYLATALSTLVLDGDARAKVERLLVRLARLLAGQPRGDALANEIEALHVALRQVRRVERTWDAVRSMIDDRFPRTWSGPNRAHDLRDVGLPRPPDQAVVGLAIGRRAGLDPVDEAIQRDQLQRSSVELARTVGNAVAGKVGDHGIVFLLSFSGSAPQRRRKLLGLVERAGKLARDRFGLALYFGASVASTTVPISRGYQAALGAAESALARGEALVTSQADAEPGTSLQHVREELGRAALEQPGSLGARFEGYVETVALHTGYRIDPARAHLEVGFEKMAEGLRRKGLLDEKSFSSMRTGLERASASARTVGELFAAYRRAASDLADAVAQPVASRRDRSLGRAVDYIHQHYTEAIRLATVARMAGFTPSHFSRLFTLRERVPFVDYVAALRLERAKQLLAGTDLDATRVAELSGYNSSQYFCRVFRRATGRTPLAYRRRPMRA